MSIELFSNEKIAETSSKGNQEKWLNSNRWYKLDQFGYEALAEVICSKILERSNINDTPFTFVKYQMERINVHGRERSACSSANFKKERESIITLSHLYRNTYGTPLPTLLRRITSDKKRISFLAEETANITGLTMFPEYLTMLFEFDGLVLNDDRHLNNIAVIMKEDAYSNTPKYDYCPIFDNGAALLSNVQLAPLDISPKAHIRLSRARPFNTTFNRQVNTIRDLYGPILKIEKLSESHIRTLAVSCLDYYPERDRGLILERVIETIRIREKALFD